MGTCSITDLQNDAKGHIFRWFLVMDSPQHDSVVSPEFWCLCDVRNDLCDIITIVYSLNAVNNTTNVQENTTSPLKSCSKVKFHCKCSSKSQLDPKRKGPTPYILVLHKFVYWMVCYNTVYGVWCHFRFKRIYLVQKWTWTF